MEAPKGKGDRLGTGKEVCQGEQAPIATQLLSQPHSTLPSLPTFSLLVPTATWT